MVLLAALAAGLLLLCQYGFGWWPLEQAPGALWAICCFIFCIVLFQGLLLVHMARQRRASARLSREKSVCWRTICDAAPDLICRHDADGRICYASPASAVLLGYAPQSLVGYLPVDLVHPDDRGPYQALRAMLKDGQSAELEMRLARADGEYVWVAVRVCPLAADMRDSAGAGTVSICRDITAQKAREEHLVASVHEAEAANQAKTRFLANMSHELRTPLNAILGFSEVMIQEMFGPLGASRYMEYSRLIHESGSHLLELINSVLDLSKIEAGKLEILEECFDLTGCVDQVLHFVRIAAERAEIHLVIDIDPAAAEVFADRRAVGQMLINLFSNAIKYTPAGGEVCLTARRREKGIEIAVSDTGTGIAPADIRRLGKPFEQTRSASGKEGTGLGLALVKAYAQLHGGEVILQSVVGVGTTVRLMFPRGICTDSAATGAAPEGLRTVA